MIDFPSHVTTVLVQIGAFLEPLFPPAHAVHTASIIVEPVTATRRVLFEKCWQEEAVRNETFCRDRVAILGVAVSNFSGLGTMHFYNWGGVASSLSTINPVIASQRYGKATSTTTVMPWNKNGHKHMQDEHSDMEFVPVLSLAALIDSIPIRIKISQLLLDMQGHDLLAVSSCVPGGQLRRVRLLTNECWGESTTRFYIGVDNSCNSWHWMMGQNGFWLRERRRAWGDRAFNLQEYDVIWENGFFYNRSQSHGV